MKGACSFLMAKKTVRGCQGVGSGMSSTFSLFKDGLYNLLGYIIIFFFPLQLHNPNL